MINKSKEEKKHIVNVYAVDVNDRIFITLGLTTLVNKVFIDKYLNYAIFRYCVSFEMHVGQNSFEIVHSSQNSPFNLNKFFTFSVEKKPDVGISGK